MPEQKGEQEPTKTSNIFEEFAGDPSLTSEVTTLEKTLKKDSTYYMKIVSYGLKGINSLFLFFLVLLILYFFIQNREEPLGLGVLTPVCSIFIGSTPLEDLSCEGITVVSKQYNAKLDAIKQLQFSVVKDLVEPVYHLDLPVASKEVNFLVFKSENRMKPLSIIKHFETLRQKFESFDPNSPSRITCEKLSIEEDTIKMSCKAYSRDWETALPGLSGEENDATAEGTSITVAMAFMRYLQVQEKDFIIINEEKSFKSEKAEDNSYFTKQTPFTLELKYKPDNL